MGHPTSGLNAFSSGAEHLTMQSDVFLVDLIAKTISDENLNQVHLWEKLPPGARLMFIVCGKYQEAYGAIPKTRILAYLRKRFPKSYPGETSAEDAWTVLRRDLRWIMYYASSGGWYRLSPKGKCVYDQLDEETMKKVDRAFDIVCSDIRQLQMPPKLGFRARPDPREGHDLLLYFDAGESDRILEQVKADRSLYSGCLVICSNDGDPELRDLLRILEKKVDTDPIVVEHQGWEPEKTPQVIHDFLFAKRYRLKFLCSAYPRIGLFALAETLLRAMDENGYYVEFSYARAEEYTYDSGSSVGLKVVPSTKRSFRRLVWFSEVNDLRLEEALREIECEELHAIVTSDLVGGIKFNPQILSMLRRKQLPEVHVHFANFLSVGGLRSCLQGLNLTSEDCVVLGGNRWSVLASALLFHEFLSGGREPFGIAWAHIYSGSYSRGFESLSSYRAFARHVDGELDPLLTKVGGMFNAPRHFEPGSGS